MDKCGICEIGFGSSKEARDVVMCTGQCNKYFHINCTSLKNENCSKVRGAKKTWKCDICYNEGDLQDIASILKKQLDEIKNKMCELDDIKSKIEELQKSIEFCSDKIDDFNKTQTELIVKVNNLDKINVHLTEENKKMKEEIKTMSHKINVMDQTMINNDIEIVGVPVTPNESCEDIVKTIGQLITANPENIMTISRSFGSKVHEKNNIIVKFKNSPKSIFG